MQYYPKYYNYFRLQFIGEMYTKVGGLECQFFVVIQTAGTLWEYIQLNAGGSC